MRRPDYTEQFKAKAAHYIKNGKYKEALYYLKKLDPDISDRPHVNIIKRPIDGI